MNPSQLAAHPENTHLSSDVSSERGECLLADHYECAMCTIQPCDVVVQNPSQSHLEYYEEEEWDLGDDLLTDFYSDMAEQVEWEERLEQGFEITHCCASCTYFCRDYRPPISCAIHPEGMGVDATSLNKCPDWKLIDVTWALFALKQSLIEELSSIGQQWRILRIVYPDPWGVEALVRVDNQLRNWSASFCSPPEELSIHQIYVCDCGPCWKNLGDKEAYVVWINPDLE